MKTIKIGRKEYDVKKGDYVQYNGAVYLFCAGDGRTLKREGWDMYTYLHIPKSVLKKIELKSMDYESISYSGLNIERWYF